MAPITNDTVAFLQEAKAALTEPVSYTHLDVYKRQVYHYASDLSTTILYFFSSFSQVFRSLCF